MNADRSKNQDHFICPHCGAEVPLNASVCTECGSDAKTGWSDDADMGEVDVPTGYGKEEEFNYSKFVEREFPRQAPSSFGRTVKAWAWWMVIAVVGALLILYGFIR